MIKATSLSGAIWRKSSYSGENGGACVEVADGFPGVIPIRDSKDSQGPALIFPAGSWAAFISIMKAER
jgi:hypothetical protein